MDTVDVDGLSFYADLIKNRKNVKIYSPNNAMHKDKYIIQWENVMQSFDTGIVCLMGAIRREDDSSLIQQLDEQVMTHMDFYDIWNRKSGSIFDFIKDRHAEQNIILTDDYMHSLTREVMDHIIQEPTGILFTISPMLSFFNALITLYANHYLAQVIFVIDNQYVNACPDAPFTLLLEFFPKEDDCAIYIDYRTTSFYEYIIQYLKTATEPLHIVCTEPQLLIDSVRDTTINNMTYILPESTVLDIDHEIIAGLSLTCKRNEYICYKQRPCVIE
jgi:hypothetical protein